MQLSCSKPTCITLFLPSTVLAQQGITMVTSSPFLRCLQTAQEACQALELPGITITNSMCEVLSSDFGVHEKPSLPTPDLPQNIHILHSDKEPLPSYPEENRSATERSHC